MNKAKILQRLSNVETMTEVLAVPPDRASKTPSSDSRGVFDRLHMPAEQALADIKLLENAGWTFHIPEDTHEDGAYRVVKDSDGHVKIEGKTLTVRLKEEVPSSSAQSLFDIMGLRVRRKLGLLPNTFLLEQVHGSAIECAKALNKHDEVLFAEPNLVEPIRGRR